MFYFNKKAQVSVEYLMLVGVAFLIIIPIIYYATTTLTENVTYSKSENFIKTIATNADRLYSLGPGSKKSISLELPGNVESIQILDKEIILKYSKGNNLYDIAEFTKGNITGSISTISGLKLINLEVLESGIVQIGSENDTSAPVILLTLPSEQTLNPVILSVITNEFATCKYSTIDTTYDLMPSQLTGTATDHSASLNLSDGSYTYYSKCKDLYENTMQGSVQINFIVNSSLYEVTPPEEEPEELILNSPTLILPANASTGISRTPTFQWSAVSGANNYLLQVSQDYGSFTNIIINTTTSSTSYTQMSSITNNAWFTWHVLAINSTQSNWSTEFVFKT